MFHLKKTYLSFFVFFLLGLYNNIKAQQSGTILGQDTTRRPIITAVPFLTIAPDARAAGMGDVGVATTPDVNSIYWNPAKLSFLEKQSGFALSYSPWLRNLVNDMFLAYLSGYYKIDKLQAVGMSLRYFNLGDIQFTDNTGQPIRDFTPREFALDATYSRKLSEQLSVAIAGRFIHSNLSADLIFGNQQESKAGTTGAADLALYYINDKLNISGREASLAFGFNISNIGAKVTYIDKESADFIPTNLRLGTALTTSLDPLNYNKLTFAVDVNKLLVPTPPLRDSRGNILDGKDPAKTTVLSGIFGSFGDAPNGFKEELQEFMLSFGMEYWYNSLFAARIGYFTEHKEKGNRKYYSLGTGIRYKNFGLDVAYLIAPQFQNSPLAETLRFGFLFDFEQKKERTFSGEEDNQ